MLDNENITPNIPTPDSSQNLDSAPVETPSEPQNAPTEGFTPIPVESPNEPVNTKESTPENASFPAGEAPAEPVPADTQSSGEAKSEPAQTPETGTAQIPVFEPLASKPSQKDLWKRFLEKVQIGKRKKLEKIMALFLEKSKITNDEVEKLLHVSDATATRYLSQLEKENKITQSGKTGKRVSYSRI